MGLVPLVTLNLVYPDTRSRMSGETMSGETRRRPKFRCYCSSGRRVTVVIIDHVRRKNGLFFACQSQEHVALATCSERHVLSTVENMSLNQDMFSSTCKICMSLYFQIFCT